MAQLIGDQLVDPQPPEAEKPLDFREGEPFLIPHYDVCLHWIPVADTWLTLAFEKNSKHSETKGARVDKTRLRFEWMKRCGASSER